MKSSVGILAVAMVLCAASAHAQLYKWVGPDGKVNYTDTPPPAASKQVERKSGLSGNVADAELPYELAQAVKNSPVTLYTTNSCIPCDDGRKLLTVRGIPFSEKTVTSNDDIAQLRSLAGDTQLPLLFIGRSKQLGFESNGWNRALSAAGYPETSRLPNTYRRGQAEAAAPSEPSVAATQDNQTGDTVNSSGSTELPPPTGNVPPGFRF